MKTVINPRAMNRIGAKLNVDNRVVEEQMQDTQPSA